jgi:transglutaminase-like putative cysteine protease
MSVILKITHTTRYRFAQPVGLGEHRVMFRPRDSHDLRVLETDLTVTPEPVDIRLIQDVFMNSVAIVQPQTPAQELDIVASFKVEHTGTRALDLPLDPVTQYYPFAYDADENIVLLPYITPYYTDPDGTLVAWARQFVTADVSASAGIGIRDVLVAMTRHIRDTFRYEARFAEGVQTPYETLARNSGTCRDFATLMIEAVRHLGYAAKFVSGYLYSRNLDPDAGAFTGVSAIGGGSTHAWLQVYLPGAGWLPFDPTNNLVGGNELVRVAFARHAEQASPVSGTWVGAPGDYLGMDVEVRVQRVN